MTPSTNKCCDSCKRHKKPHTCWDCRCDIKPTEPSVCGSRNWDSSKRCELKPLHSGPHNGQGYCWFGVNNTPNPRPCKDHEVCDVRVVCLRLGCPCHEGKECESAKRVFAQQEEASSK